MRLQKISFGDSWQSDGWELSLLPKSMVPQIAMDENLAVTLAIGDVLDTLKVRWFLGGSLASSVHGIPRATLDADIVADLRASHVGSFLRALGEDWYVEENSVWQAITERGCFNLIHFETAMKIDVLVPKLRRFDGGQFSRAKRTAVSEGSVIEIPVCSAEDIVLAKLEWYRAGGELSERQWGDIIGVLKVSASRLDLDCMRDGAAELAVLDLLAKALIAAGVHSGN